MSLRKKPSLEFFRASQETKLEIPFADFGISAGFPSPAMDFMESKIDISTLLIKNPETTFYARASGNSMIKAGIDNDDLLVIDRSLQPAEGKIAICYIDGDFTVKRLKIQGDGILLLPENDSYQPIKITGGNHFMIWGIVTFVIKRL